MQSYSEALEGQRVNFYGSPPEKDCQGCAAVKAAKGLAQRRRPTMGSSNWWAQAARSTACHELSLDE